MHHVHGDNEFNFTDLERAVRPSLLHKHSKNEHVGFIENFNKKVKECGRAITNGLPCKRYPKSMIISLTEHVADVVNSFPSKGSVSDGMLTSLIVEVKSKIDLSKNRLPYGAHAQVWIGTKNNMTERTVPRIALRVSNIKGGMCFVSLHSGKRTNSNAWEELPISEEVVDRVEELETESK